MTDEKLTIGALARRAGVPVRTLRFWSDEGLIAVAERSSSGYRLYGADAIARVDLVRTLRELGVGLAEIAEVLRQRKSVAEVAEAHVAALDAQLRALAVQRTVLKVVAKKQLSAQDVVRLSRLAKLTGTERRQRCEAFVAEVLTGIDPESVSARITAGMALLPSELPSDPSAEQTEAWLELSELLSDPGFVERVKGMARAGGQPAPRPVIDVALVSEHAAKAEASSIAPESMEARTVLDRIVPPGLDAEQRASLAASLEQFTDRRVERYWQLLAVLNGWKPRPPLVPAFEWLIAALRAEPLAPCQ